MSTELRRELHILHFQLHARVAVVFVDLWLNGQVDLSAGRELVEQMSGAEGNASHVGISLADVELEMIAGFADAARGTGELDIAQAERGLAVAVAERAQAREIANQRFGHVGQLGQAFELQFGREHFRCDDR